MNLHYEIEMLSDWRCGSGTGNHGSIDGTVKRDELGLPFAPAKTVTGIFRDSAEIVAAALDSGTTGPYAELVQRLFGSQPNQSGANGAPVPAALSIRRARMHKSFRYAATKSADAPPLVRAMTIERPGVKIESSSGRAQDASLRFHEYARVGIRLYGSLTVAPDFGAQLSQHQLVVVENFLAAVAVTVEGLGGKRKRGSGRCTVRLYRSSQAEGEHDETSAIRVDVSALAADPPSFLTTDQWFFPTALVNKVDFQAQAAPAMAMMNSSEAIGRASVFVLTTESSLCIQESANGNVVTSGSVIPGRFFLPAVLKTLARHGISAGEALAPHALRISNAYPLDNRTMLEPAPFSLLHPKLTRPGEQQRAASLFGEVPTSPHKPARGSFVAAERGSLTTLAIYHPAKTLNTHNSIDDATGRPNSSIGGLFSVEAIPVATQFSFEVLLSNQILDRIPADWDSSLVGKHEIGKSSKDDYGLVSVAKKTEPAFRFQEHKTLTEVLLLSVRSIVLLRDGKLRPTTKIDDLIRALRMNGLPVAINEPLDSEGNALQTGDSGINQAVAEQRLEGWQRQWGLSAPSQIGIAPGSVLRLRLDWKAGLPPEFTGPVGPGAGSLNEDQAHNAVLERLNWIERWGIGERTTEGYGSVVFRRAATTYSGLTERKFVPQVRLDQSAVAVPQTQMQLCEAVATEMWKRAIEKQIDHIAGSPQKRALIIGSWKSKGLSQLGALRSNLRLIDDSGAVTLLAWLTHLKAVANRREKWGEGSIGQIEAMLSSRTEVWKHLYLPSVDRIFSVGQAEALQLKLWPFAVRTLLAECARAEQKDLQKRPTNSSSSAPMGIYRSPSTKEA